MFQPTTYTFSIWFVLDEWCHATQSTESQDSSEDCNGTEAEGIPGTTTIKVARIGFSLCHTAKEFSST